MSAFGLPQKTTAAPKTIVVKARAFAPNKNPSAVAEITVEVMPTELSPTVTAMTDVSQYEIGENYAKIVMKLENPDGYVIRSYGFNIVSEQTEVQNDYKNTSVAGSTTTLLGKAFTVNDLAPGNYAYTFFAEFDMIGIVYSETETFTIGAGAQDPQPQVTPGDVDLDGEVTAADARLALRRAVELDDHLTAVQLRNADVDGEAGVSAADARLILRAAVGLEDPKTWK